MDFEFMFKKNAEGKDTCLSCQNYNSNKNACTVARNVIERSGNEIVAFCNEYKRENNASETN